MNRIRIVLAVFVCKLSRAVIRLLGRGGTAFPGRIALKICPDVLSALSKGVRTILITGTNGKTTSARMIEQAFIDQKRSYLSNKSGANLISGITAEFAMNSSITGHCKKEYAIIECDEAASKTVLKYLKPEVIVATNVFRDQLDRYGEITHTLNNIIEGISHSPESLLCLNADCSLISSIPEHVPNPVVFFGINVPLADADSNELSDASHCIHCKTEYEYAYHTYGHLGGFHCPKCGYSRPTPQYAVTEISALDADSSSVNMDLNGRDLFLHINLPAVYNIYNAAGAAAALDAFGFQRAEIASALASFDCGFGRMEKFDLEGRPGRMMLVKNPAGCNQVMRYLAALPDKAMFVVCLNDNDADGTDISWIWDADFERLSTMGERLDQVLVSGIRAEDMLLRLKYAGVPENRMTLVHDYADLIDRMCSSEHRVFIMPTYTAMLDLRSQLQKRLGGKEFWE